MHLRTRPSLHDMWSRGEHKQPRVHHNQHTGLRDRLQIRSKHSKSEVQNAETTKAVAWAVFQHHGGGDGRGNHGQFHSSMGVRRPTRFKIEAQMKQQVAHRSFMPEVVAVRWDAGSTLFDSFELDSLLKTLDQATHPGDHEEEEDARAVVVYSPKEQIPQTRFSHEDDDSDDDDDDDSVFTPKQSLKPAKEVPHHTLWKSFLHSLHLDGAMFHGLQKLQSQVAPHDSKLEHKGRTLKANGDHRHGQSTHIDAAQFDALFHRNDLPVSKDGRAREPHLWKLSFKAPFRGHSKGQDLHDHHHHHHHYHHHDEGDDYEMTIQAISRRAVRTSLDEKLRSRRVSIEFEGGLEAPRNSLDIDAVERVAMQPKARSVWDSTEL